MEKTRRIIGQKVNQNWPPKEIVCCYCHLTARQCDTSEPSKLGITPEDAEIIERTSHDYHSDLTEYTRIQCLECDTSHVVMRNGHIYFWKRGERWTLKKNA